MARMTPDEWRKKKKEGLQGTTAPPVTDTEPTTNTELGNTSSGRMSPIEWKAKKSASSLQAWTSYAKSLLNETQNYFSTWRKYDDADEEYAAIRNHRSNILAQADAWRKQYAGNDEAIAHINSVVSALAESSDFAVKGFDHYSKWATNDDYQKAVRESGYLEKHEGKSYDDILSTLGQMEDGEEKEWLTKYGSVVDRNEKLAADLGAADSEIKELEDFYDKAFAVESWYTSYRMNPDAWEQDAVNEQMAIYNELKEKYGSVSDLKKMIQEKKQYRDSASKVQESYALSSVNDPNSEYYDPDFEKYSQMGAAIKNPSLNDAEGWLVVGDYHFGGDDVGNIVTYSRDNYLAILAGERQGGGMVGSTKYMEMTGDEVAIYNYHLAKNGKEAAQNYLDSLELKGRHEQKNLEMLKSFTEEHPVLASGMSVGSSLASGIEYVSDSVRYLTGIDEEMDTNLLSQQTNVIRGTVSDMVDWEIGNWDAFDFVYNTTMSGVDSFAAAALGNYGGIVLGLSAAAQGTNDALARGMSDSQAFWNGLFSGVFEGLFETISIGQFKALKEVAPESVKAIIKNLGKSMLVNATEEMATEFANITYDTLINGEFANYTLDELMNGAWKQAAAQIIESGASGALMGLGFGSAANVGGYFSGKSETAEALYGSDPGALVGEALEINPNNKFARRMQTRLDNGKTISGGQMNRLMNQNEKALYKQDVKSIQSATEQRLTELGETGDVSAIAAALTKQVAGKNLTNSERQIIAESKYGQRVANELNAENIQSGDYDSAWAENIGTERINVQEYSRLLEAAQLPQETAEVTGDQVATEVQNEAQTVQDNAPAVSTPANDQTVDSTEATDQESLQVAEESQVTEEAETVTLENVSQKYGAQAQDMVSTYNEGQDVAKYDAAYKVAYDMGKSFVSAEYAMKSDATSYLTEKQRQLAYNAGEDAARQEADARDAKNKNGANGNTGRKKGTVRVEGASAKELYEALNLPQKKGYQVLSTVVEATGVNIVFSLSEANAEGKYDAAQGKYKRKDPGTLYIDLNAGLRNISDETQLNRYMMLRTFAHEFTHFIENWNPIQYNEFRKVVFDTMTERGENVHDLIEDIQSVNPGMDYDTASREVVAEAMVDMLQDSNFVQELAENHKSIFQKLLDKLKEFVENIKVYFATVGNADYRGAVALKEQVGDTVKYLDSIVKMWDQIAVQAVENYQKTVATEEVAVAETETTTSDTTTVSKTETVEAKKPANKEKKPTLPKTKKADWAGHDVEWSIPGKKTPIAYSTKATSDLIEVLADDNPTATISELKGKIGYDAEAKKVLQRYIDAGYGDQVANEWFSYDKKGGKKLATEEVNANVENVDNQGTVQQSEPDGTGTAPVLDEREAGDVSGDGIDGDAVADTSERGQQTVRDGGESDHSERNVRGHGEGSGQSGDLRGSDRVSQEEQSAREYATQKGYGLKINSLTSKKGMTQVDIYDRNGLPTSRYVMINEVSDWNKVKQEIDKHGEWEKERAERLHEEVVEQIEQKSTEQPKGRNFVIGESLDLPNGEKSRYKANIEAIKLVKKLEAEGRYATEAEQIILSKYVGWGGLANAFDQRKADWAKEYTELKELLTDEEYTSARGSTLNAHYTDISVIRAMYDGLKQLGFTGGRMLEPSSGVGNFVGAMPADMASQVRSWTMVELDGITGLIAKHLYPNADVRIQGFEKANIPNNFMDVAISNVPFGNYAVVDKAYPKKVTSAIHNYFFAKTLDKVRPGGIVMFITSSYTMNARENTVRRYIMQKADLLGAIRLPDTAFKGNAGTEVVTDILVLKKRADNTAYAGEDFLEAPYQYLSGYNGANINSYFTNHPEMVLGTASFDGGMYRGGNLTYKALEGKGTLADQIREAFKNIQGKMEYPAQRSPEKTNFAVERAGKKTKENGLVVKEGKVYRNTNGELVEQNVAKGVAERISGMLEIRDAAKELQNYLQQGLNDTEIRKARTKLNKAYDAFVKKHGFINSQTNRNAIKADPDSFSILALENWNPETKKATKADIFSKNTIAANRTVTSAKDVAEGLIVSVNQTGGVDTALIAKLTGKTEAEVTSELLESRQAFKNRDGQLETAEVYLSGNVRAKLRDAEAMVPMDADYQKNVEALKAVVPEDVGYQDIFVNPGTPWIPDSVYSDFVAYMLGTVNHEWNKAVDVTRSKDTGNFTVELRSKYLKTNSYNTQKWGTSRRSFLDLFDAMLNSKSVVVKDKLADGSYIINKDATAAANEKIENIQKEFQEWLWKDETRRAELATLYNETFNSVVTPKYNGDNLTVNGANAMKPLRPHQRNAVQRIISSGGNTLLAHKVGAGKTYEMAAAAMKLKQLGLVKKPMFAVPKNLLAQWGNEFIDYFPTAKLLVSDKNDFTAANRKIFMNRVANGDYDAVIVTYEQFEKLPVSDDFTRELYQEQINSVIIAIEEAKAEKGGKSLSVKDLEKKRKSLQAKIDKLSDTAKDEDNISFEQLGVDSIFVDEAHNFKNLFYTTSMTNVAGLGNKDGAKRSFDLYTKVRYLQKLNGGRGIVFATATPVMNSMSEMYIMQKYLQPDLLEQLGLHTFDAWAKQFGEVVNGVEIKPSGQGYRVKQSFSRFKNMSELQLLFRNFADVLTDVPGLKIPKMKGGRVNVVVCEPGQFQQDYMKELEKRADNIKSVDPSVDNMLKITSDGRKISYTQRMIDPTLPYEEGCKIYRCADNVVELYQESKDVKGTQLIFCDMATPKGKSNTATTETDDVETDMESAKLYDDLKARLVKGGIPAKQIAFIHEADTDAKRAKLFADVNDGTVRVLIGSTGKMGVGMNAQKRVVAIHHLDAPWRPGDVEQRNGRAFRQGNINDEVECFTYVTEGSFDARLWDILERKQNFINQVMNGENVGRETEDTGEVTLSAAEVKALASGSPLIMEQVQLDTDIKKLESLYRAHRGAVTNAKSRMEKDKGTIASLEKYITNGKADLVARVDTYSEGKFSITVGKQKFTEKKDAGVALMAEATAKANEAGYTTIGKFAGFDLRVIKTHEGIKGLISGQQGYSFNTYPNNTTFMINHLVAAVEGMSEKVQQWEMQLTETRKDLAEQEKLIDQPFAKQAELEQKRARYNEVMEILNPKEEQSLDSVDDDDVQYQSRNYLSEDETYDHRGIQTGSDRASGQHQSTQGRDWGTADDGRGYRADDRRTRKVKAWGNLSAKRRLGIVNAVNSHINSSSNYTEIRHYLAATINKPVTDMNMYDKQAAVEKLAQDLYESITDLNNSRPYVEQRWSFIGNVRPIIEAIYGENVQFQQRTDSLTDREVLLKAFEEVNTFGWDEGQMYALDLLQQSVSKLEALEVERAELGRLYRDQQFGVKVDREAAAKTLNRMKILDSKIEDANAEVLSLENKKVLREVLQKARKVVEAEERQRGDERLKRWRDRRKNADAIKKYRERLRKDVNDLTDWVLHPNNKDIVKHIPDALKSSVIPFLSSIDFTSKQQLRGGDATKADQEFMKRLKGLKSALKPQMNLGDMYEGYTDLAPNFMERLQAFIDTTQDLVNSNSGEFVVNQMTSDELRELSQVVRTLKEYIQNFNKFHANAMFQHVSEAGDNSIGSLEVMANAGPRTGTVSNFVFWQQMRPAYAFERFGEGGKAIYDGLRRGQAKLAFNTKVIVEFSEKTYTEDEVKAWEKQTKEFALGSDIVKIPIANIMSFYELSKRPQALGHIIGQGIRVATYKANGKKISDVGHQLNEEDIKTIIGSLTDRQKEVADKLQKFMQDQGGKWGNYVSLKRFGEELFGDEHYFPINSDGRHLQANADEGPSAASLYALLNMGFTKSVTEGANNRLVLYSIFDVFANHMASMAQYNALALPVVDALKWFNYQQKSDPDEDGKRLLLASVRDQMDRVYGVPEETRPGSGRQGYAQTFVVNILKAFNGTEAQGVPTDAIGIDALHRYNVAQVAYNFRVVVQQPLAITRAALLIDYGSIIKGMKLSPAAIQKNIQEMQHHSGIAAWKSLGFYDVNISRGLTDLIKHKDNWMDKVTEAGMWGAEKADLLTWAGIWSACKEEVIKKQRLTPKSEGFYEAVTQLFEEVIYKTQVVDSILTKNEYLRSKGLFARLTGSFMSEPTTTASMLIDAYDKYHADIQRGMTRQQAWKKNGRMIGRTAYVYGLSAAILAAVQAVADAFRDDDDYEEWYEKWLEAFGGNLIDETMPFNKLPLFSQVYEFAKEMIAVGGFDIYGQMSNLPYVEIAEKLIKGTEILYDKITGVDTNYTYYAGIYKIFQGLSGISGLPMAAATREITTAWNNIVGAMAPSLKVQTYDPGEKKEIKNAYQDGYLTDEEAVAELLKQGLVDNEDEAYWLIQGWEAGDGYSRYDAILGAVRNGGDIKAAMAELTAHGYKEDDVLSQVKSQIGDWYKNGEITKQQATDMLSKYFDMDNKNITSLVNEWSCKVVTGIAYGDIKDEYLNGNITAAKAIEMRVRYGGETQKDASAVVQKWTYEKDTGYAYDDMKDTYIAGKISDDEVILSMQQYGGVAKSDAKATVQKWNCEKDTGIAYDDLQGLYVSGDISAERAIKLRVKYGGNATEDARKTVLEWQCEKDHGVKYSDISSAYLSGDISESTAVKWLVKYGERSQEDAQLAVQAYRWKDKNPEYSDLSDAAIDRYINYCEPSGIEVSVFYEAKKYTGTIEGDGTSGSVKRQYVQYILSLGLTYAQQNAMWHALKISSWKEKDTPFY